MNESEVLRAGIDSLARALQREKERREALDALIRLAEAIPGAAFRMQ